MNITLATHYCGDKAVATSVVLSDEEVSCGMEEMENACNSHSPKPKINAKKCCSTEYTQIGIEEDLNISEAPSYQPTNDFITFFGETFIQVNSINSYPEINYNLYCPPQLGFDIPILIQTIRI